MKNNDLTIRFGIIQWFYWMCFAPILAFVSLYLLDCGFTSSAVGTLIAVAGIVSAVLQPMVAAYADRPDSMSLKTLNLLIGGLTLCCGAGMLLFRGSRMVTLLLYGGSIALLQLSTPLVNALGMNSINCGSRLNFGVSKAAGSLGYALIAAVLGKLADRFGSITVPISMVVLYTAFLASVAVYPKQKAVAEQSSGSGTGFWTFFRKYPRLMVVLVGCVGLFVSHTLLNSFTLQIVQTKGGSGESMGLAMALAGLSELPVAAAFSLMLRKAGSHVWLRLTGVFFTLKTLLTLVCTNMTEFYLVQPLQMFAWALISVSAVYYINAVMEPADAVKGQGFYTMSYTVGSVVGAIAGGRIIDAMGVPAMLIFGTVIAGIGTVLIAVFAEKTADRIEVR